MRWRPLSFLTRDPTAPVGNGFEYTQPIPRIPTIVPHDDLARLHQMAYQQTVSHNTGVASSRLPISEAQAWYKKITSAFGTVYFNNAGGKRGVPYSNETLPDATALLLVGNISAIPHNLGAVGYESASSGVRELYGLDSNPANGG